MERKQGFFSSPVPSRTKSPAKKTSPVTAATAARKLSPVHPRTKIPKLSPVNSPTKYPSRNSSPVRRRNTMLPPLKEGVSDVEEDGIGGGSGETNCRRERWFQLVRCVPFSMPSVVDGDGPSCRQSDLLLLLGVMGAPLAPVHVAAADPLPKLNIKGTLIGTLSAQYILQQYTAASGGRKLQSSIRSSYAMGKVRMVASEFDTAAGGKVGRWRGGGYSAAKSGGFVLWQMSPDKWYAELSIAGAKVAAGSDGTTVWRRVPWLAGAAHAVRGPSRPLRRALQGLDPMSTAAMFAAARIAGEKEVDGEDCFVLKLCADQQTLMATTGGNGAETIRHVVFGYFSQRTGLLVKLEDSNLARINPASSGDVAVYWETSISSVLGDYRSVDGVAVSHSGRSVATLFRFGEAAMSHSKTTMEEEWSIEDVVFNVPGLSSDCFIAPADLISPGELRVAKMVNPPTSPAAKKSQAKVVAVATLPERT